MTEHKLFQKGRSEPELPPDDMANQNAWMQAMDQKAWREACKITHDILFILFCAGMLWFFCFAFAEKVKAEDICNDPALTAELKKACYESVKMCQEIGCTVSTR